MRTVSSVAFVTLLVALACLLDTAAAGVVSRGHPVADRHRARMAKFARNSNNKNDPPAPPMPTPSASNNTVVNGGAVLYAMMYKFHVALTAKNYTAAGAMIHDDAILFVPAYACRGLTKAEFLALAESVDFTAGFFQLGAFAGYHKDTDAFFEAQLGTVMGGNSNSAYANETLLVDVLLWGMLDESATQFLVYEQLQDLSSSYPNATRMLAPYQEIRDAASVLDATPFEKLLTPDATFDLDYAWDQFPHFDLPNRSAIVQFMTQGFSQMRSQQVAQKFAWTMCRFVLASIVVTTRPLSGKPSMMKFYAAFGLTEDYRIMEITEHTAVKYVPVM